jgi:aryl-alcohol dehydrogenase-like predicted oxidoreductase
MESRQLGQTGLLIAPVVFGGNVFGWTADKATSFDLLDRFFDAGFNAIDTANSYQTWVAGNTGMSEIIIGEWMKSRSKRDQVVLITKVGSDVGQGKQDLSSAHIKTAVEDSLRRLQTDRIDLYFSHWYVPDTPYAETLAAYDALIKAGKVRAIGASNHNAAQLRDALTAAKQENLPRYQVVQPEYNLYDRSDFEGPLRDLCIAESLGVTTYFALAKGFLSGKYRSADDLGQSPRGDGVGAYLNPRGYAILDALDQVAAKHNATPAQVALAWIIAAKGVTAPIASATSLRQLNDMIRSTQLTLDGEDMRALDEAGSSLG